MTNFIKIKKIFITTSILLFLILFYLAEYLYSQEYTYPEPQPGESIIIGRVVDKETGEILPSVEIIAFKLENGQMTTKIYSDITDSTGAYLIDRITPGEYLITVYPVEYDVRKKYLFKPSEQKINVSGGKSVIELKFFLQRGGTVSGTIFQNDGITPLSNADIYAFTDKGYFQITKTDSRGRYILSGLKPQNLFQLKITTNGYYLEKENLSIGLGENIDNIDFILPRETPTQIEGAVILEGTNNTVSNTGVIFLNEKNFAISLTDNLGKYSIIGLHSGTYEVFAYAEGYSELHKIDVIITDGMINKVDLILPLHTGVNPQKKGRYAPCIGKEGIDYWKCKVTVDFGCRWGECDVCCFADKMECENNVEKCPEDVQEEGLRKCNNKYISCLVGCKK
jgi:hypothetical protein